MGIWRRKQGDAAMFIRPFAVGEQQTGDRDRWVCGHTSCWAGGSAAAQGTKERLWSDVLF